MGDPQATEEDRQHVGSCVHCSTRVWERNEPIIREHLLSLLWCLMKPEGSDACVQCRGGKHRANCLAHSVFVLMGIPWVAHRYKLRKECNVTRQCRWATREEIQSLANLHNTVSHAAVIRLLNR